MISTSGITVAPVVLNPEQVSKKALMKLGMLPVITKGIAPMRPHNIQETDTIKAPSRIFSLLLLTEVSFIKSKPITDDGTNVYAKARELA